MNGDKNAMRVIVTPPLGRWRGFLLLFLFCLPACAQKSLTDSIHSLEAVMVYGQKGKEVVPSQTLSGERLQSLNSFSVADAIRYFSGVQIKDYGGVGGLKTIDIRSMGTNHMGVFYDGIQLGNAQNGQIDLGKFSLDNIEEISLYNGQKSSIFQPAKDYGSSGTIYIRSRRPKFSKDKPYNIRATMRTGSFGLLNPSFLWEQKLSRYVSMSLNAEYTYATGKYKFRYRKVFSDGTVAWDTTATRRNGDIHALRLESSLHGRIRDGYWQSKFYFYDSEKGIPGAIVNNVWKHSQRQWDRNFFAQGTVQKTFGKYEVQANVKFARDKMHYLNPDTTLLYIDNTFWQNEWYASIANHYELRHNWDLGLSVDYQHNTLDATMKDFVEPVRNTYLIAAATTYELWRFRLMASLLGTFVNDHADRFNEYMAVQGATGDTKRFNAWTPSVFLSCNIIRSPRSLTDGLFLRAFYKRIFRMPTFNDLYYTDIGNISLRPEYTTQWNFGMEYNNTLSALQWQLKVDGYYNKVRDKIIAVPKGTGQYRWMMMNIGEVRIKGVDVNANLSSAIGNVTWKLGLAYTYQTAQDYSDPEDNGDGGTYKGQIAYIPWHNGSATLNLRYRTWGLNYAFAYVGERYHTSANIRANYEQPWYTHDLGITKQFRLRRVMLNAALEVNNVFDQQYDVVLNYPMPGRNYKLILKVEL